MSTQEKEFINELKVTIMRGLVGFAGLILIGLITFYFTTTYRLSNLEEKTKTLSESKADKAIMEVQLHNIDQSLNEIKQKLQ